MLDALVNLFSKIISDETVCYQRTITSTTMVSALADGAIDEPIKCVEIKNRSGVDINVVVNGSPSFPLLDGEDRLVYTRKLSRIKLARNAGSGDVIVHFIYEI